MGLAFQAKPLATAILIAIAPSCAGAPAPGTGSWRAWLDSPGGQLPFGMELTRHGDDWNAVILNGPERIELPEVTVGGGRLELNIPHYDARIYAAIRGRGDRLDGEWTKRTGPDAWSRLGFHADRGELFRFLPLRDAGGPTTGGGAVPPPPAGWVAGRWRVQFSKSEDEAVAVFEEGPEGSVTGTFLTTTGDYRFLAGSVERGRLRLSAFDGAHAFLFDARLAGDGALTGRFWSRDSWNETWTAVPDANAALADPFGLTAWVDGVDLDDLVFYDLAGSPRSLGDPELAEGPLLIELFGSWCPNCGDAAAYLSGLHRRYADRGLSIVGLAFEISGDRERDTRLVRAYAERHGIEFPLLMAGLSDKSKASEAFPAVDRVRAFPTMVFIDREGTVRAVHTGFAGPATGDEFRRQSERIETLIEELVE
ncbi:MAG: TlpA family protein disulfide reductase [Acidobacteriota bacterium]|nr:TlpA family protein disulfide reductase [Acidobacteriota bacterium]